MMRALVEKTRDASHGILKNETNIIDRLGR
jgi:hypothetical protein